MIKLSEVFSDSQIVRDADARMTLGPGSEHQGSVCYALEPPFIDEANANANVAAIITTKELASRVDSQKGCVVSDEPKLAFYTLHNRLFESGSLKPHALEEIHPSAAIAPSAIIGKHVVIEAGVTICHGAIVEDYSIIGADTYIGPNCVIGARGLQNTQVNGQNIAVAFAGAVRIGRRCEILAAAVIPKPYLCEFTEVGDDVKLGSRASIGHGCHVGASTIIGTQSVIGGNGRVGSRVWLGPNVIIADGLKVGSDARVLIGSVVVRDVAEGAVVSGNFALDHNQHLKHFTRMRHGM